MGRVITLLTDFGTADGYVGEVKGVLLSGAPDASIVDITHDIPAQDVDYARLVVARVWRRFPEGTIHVVVVDPGVGTSRAAIAIEADGRYLVGPDNGVLSPALLVAGARAFRLNIPRTASATFHGRDVFAPTAAALANGANIDHLGEAMASPVVRRTPEAVRLADGRIRGEIIAVDRFGNAITNILGIRSGVLEVDGAALALKRTYAEVDPGEPVAVVGSSGFIEVAVRNGSAAERFGLARGATVIFS